MGMYTGLRGKIKLKNNQLSRMLIEENFDWRQVNDDYSSKSISLWANIGRCNFIPHGAVCYMPESWGEQFRLVNGFALTFCCSLKNYNSEIQTFVEKVLPEIAEDWSLECLYEESAYSILYKKGEEPIWEFNTYKDYDPYDHYGRFIEQKPFVNVYEL